MRFKLLNAVICAALCFCFAGCASHNSVLLRSQPANPLADRLKLYTSRGPKPSERTLLFLRQNNLIARHSIRFRFDPHKLLAKVEEIHMSEPTRDDLFALAELSYLAARKATFRERVVARELYLHSLEHSYAYLFDETLNIQPNAFDPQFRAACDLYNVALEELLRLGKRRHLFRTGGRVAFATLTDELGLPIASHGFPWRGLDDAEFEFVSDYDVIGLANRHRTYGLGVPLIAMRKPHAGETPNDEFYLGDFSFAATAFMRPRKDKGDSAGSEMVLELFDPLAVTSIDVAGMTVPLESDVSTPLAYFLGSPFFESLNHRGLIRPDRVEKVAGLYMVQPYQPDKIPVLMVHGLWSSPMAWMKPINDLLSDPRIRDRYQFWFYLYPTGVPFWETTAELREDLDDVRRVIDPKYDNRAIDQMVVVGHSMGGLIGKLLTSDSHNFVWNALSETPFESVDFTEEEQNEIRRVYFFEPEESVTRLVTIGSPFRGSKFAGRPTQWLAQRAISLPKKSLGLAKRLLRHRKKLSRSEEFLARRTSIDSLSPDSPILQATARLPRSAGVRHHNVVGVLFDNRVTGRTDGVVQFESAHREDVASEIVVNAYHSDLHRHPETVREIRRILRQHLDELDAQRSSEIVPVERLVVPPSGG